MYVGMYSAQSAREARYLPSYTESSGFVSYAKCLVRHSRKTAWDAETDEKSVMIKVFFARLPDNFHFQLNKGCRYERYLISFY